MITSCISDIQHYLPSRQVSTPELENLLQQQSKYTIPNWLIDTILWVNNRYWTGDDEYSSTLALCAIKKIENYKKKLQEIDLLIYASATQDCIEPSTACIVTESLWLNCASFDIQNACNSISSANDIADTYIRSGKYKKILICSGETPSKSIKFNHNAKESFKNSFSSFWFGDCGIAMILESTESDDSWLIFSKAISDGSQRQQSTILWWWSRHPHDVSHNYFIGNPTSLKSFFLSQWHPIIDQWLVKVWLTIDNIDHIIIHQVWHESYMTALSVFNNKEDKLIKTYEKYGNVWSCTIALQLSLAWLYSGHTYLILWLWAWATFSCQIYRHP